VSVDAEAKQKDHPQFNHKLRCIGLVKLCIPKYKIWEAKITDKTRRYVRIITAQVGLDHPSVHLIVAQPIQPILRVHAHWASEPRIAS